MKTSTLIVLIPLLAGCASSAPLNPGVIAKPSEAILCSNKTQCDIYWARAQSWLAQNSRYKIQTATDSLLITYPPSGPYEFGVGFQIIKTPAQNGLSNITMQVFCNIECAASDHFKPFKEFVTAE